MQRFGITIFLLLTLGSTQVRAQLSDKMVPHFGFMLERSYATDLENILGDLDWNFSTLNIGTYIALAHHKDIVSVGVDPNLHVGLSLPRGPQAGFNLLVKTPVYAMARLGAGATPYNQQNFGIGVGGGLDFQTLWITGDNRRISVATPTVILEATLVSRGSPLTGRFHFSPVDTQALFRYTGDDPGGNNGFNNNFSYRFDTVLGFGLVYGF